MAHNYILQVTAGSEYDTRAHHIVPVNSPKTVSIHTEHMSIDLNVRVQNYRGLPKQSPGTSPYFDLPLHAKNDDQYSIAFRFTPKSNISGDDLVFGNDFDHPIRDRLPPGFNTAFRIVKWVIDPGLDGDVYADKPYLYGPTASSVNILHVGGEGNKAGYEEDIGLVFEEGGDEEGMEIRTAKGVPDTDAARKKHFLNEERRKDWDWEEGKTYGCDFYNPYLDFNEFALRLPGFTLPIMKYWDGQGLRKEQKRSHTLRYVLKDRKTSTVFFVVCFTLYLKEDVDEDGNIKDGVQGGVPFENGKAQGAEDDEEDEENATVIPRNDTSLQSSDDDVD